MQWMLSYMGGLQSTLCYRYIKLIPYGLVNNYQNDIIYYELNNHLSLKISFKIYNEKGKIKFSIHN